VTAITCILPTSPILSNPSTDIIGETIATIRGHLPDAEILLVADGVREEQEERRPAYTEYLRRVLWQCSHEWTGVVPLLSAEHVHQSGLVRMALPLVRSELVLWCEHDTPLTPDCEIPFDKIAEAIDRGDVSLVRLLHEAHIHPEHGALMVDEASTDMAGIPIRRTMQFSARPFVCSTAWLRMLLAHHFSDEARCFLEDRAYGVIEQAWREHGRHAWGIWRMGIYEPPGNAKRSYHLDGRAGEPKWDETQKW